jgi:O-antigen ligase
MKKIINGILFLTITVVSFGQLQRISFLNQQVNFYLYEILMLIFILFLSIHTLVKNKFSLKKIIQLKLNFYNENKDIVKAIGYFVLALVLSLLFTYSGFKNNENLVATLYLGRMIFYFIFFLFLVFYIKLEKSAIIVVQKSLTSFFVLTLIFSAIQYFYYPDLRNLYYLGWDPHLNRLFGLYFDISILGLIFILTFIWFSKNKLLQILAVVGIFFTYSRITYISFLASTFFYFHSKINFKKILVLAALFVAILFFLPRTSGVGVRLERTFSIQSRIDDLRSGLEVFMENPLIGVGYNHIRYVKNDDSLHSGASYASSYITILVSSGLIGLFFLLNLLVVIYRKLEAEGRYLIFPILLSSLFDNVLFTGFIFVLFLTIVSINLSHKKP